MNYKIALIRGDGIGPEVVGEAVKVLEAVGQKFGHSFTYEEVLLRPQVGFRQARRAAA